jgi:D-serine deaminase-like pyridoxal phosphate-dependent protein
MNPSSSPDWYQLETPGTVPSPSLLVFPDRISYNIRKAIDLAGKPDRLRPHIKTYKTPEIVDLHQQVGIRRFKCATIAEAEMLGRCAVEEVLLAYQPVGPNIQRLRIVTNHFPTVQYGALVDTESIARQLSAAFQDAARPLKIWLDIDPGMGRTGIEAGPKAHDLYRLLSTLPGLQLGGVHAYDGHFRQREFPERKQASDQAFSRVEAFVAQLRAAGLEVPTVVAGGSPTFPVHAQREGTELSPGTYALWDAGYAHICPDLDFLPAAILLTRVISHPGKNRLCLDLGHKAVAAENPLPNRVRFLNAEIRTFVGQSEEHLIVEVEEPAKHPVGSEIYGIPWHICPTVALHEQMLVVREREVQESWWVEARHRKLRY